MQGLFMLLDLGFGNLCHFLFHNRSYVVTTVTVPI
jgi:hypothetical protein